ncbi:encapsulin, partial [Streptomyces sp. NPDC059802]
MNNLHRELAPVTEAAWDQIEEEARRTFSRHVAGGRGGGETPHHPPPPPA